MRRSIKTDKLLGSSSKTFTIKDCLVYRAGVLLNEHGTVRRANLADGIGTYNGLAVRAIGGNSNGYTQVWSVIT
jgi:hypothetical protein